MSFCGYACPLPRNTQKNTERNKEIRKSKERTGPRLHKHLPRIQNSIRIENFLDSLHDLERRTIDRVVHVLSLDVTDAVFAGDRAAEIDRELECFGNALPCAGDRVGVAEVRDECVVLAADIFDSCDELGNFRTRHDYVLVDL